MASYLKVPQVNILNALGRFRYLSAEQLSRLLYPSALSHVQTHAPILVKDGYAQVILKPNTQHGGRPRHIYTPTAKGYRYLKQKPRKPARGWNDSMQHTENANDLVILAHEFAKQSDYQVTHYLTEQELRQKPSGGVSPDGVVILERGNHQYPLVFEVDRDTQEREVFQDKLRALVDYSQFAYKVHIDSEYLIIAYLLAVDDDSRFLNMLRWCRAVVPRSMLNMFVFACFEPHNVEAIDVFTEPIWLMASASNTQPLSLLHP